MSISILIPVYNAGPYIARCLDSLISQQIHEIIIVNDGSTDLSGEMCEQYSKQDKRIKVYHQENKGVSTARNLAIEKASGEWIAFVDADDWVESNWFSTIHKNIKQHKDADLFTFGINRINKTEINCIIPQAAVLNNDDYLSKFYSPFGWSYIFRLSTIRKFNITFPISIKLSEDQCFIFEYLSVTKKIVTIDEVLYNYFYHASSAVNRSAGRELTVNSLLAANKFLEFAVLHAVNQKFYRHVLPRLYEEFFNYCSLVEQKKRNTIQNQYRDAYKKTLHYYPEFKSNKHFRLAYFNISFAVWTHYKIRNIKRLILDIKD